MMYQSAETTYFYKNKCHQYVCIHPDSCHVIWICSSMFVMYHIGILTRNLDGSFSLID